MFMNGKNNSFIADPRQFLRENIVNMTKLLGEDMRSADANQNMINNSKVGYFDFQEWQGNVLLRFLGVGLGAAAGVVNDNVLLAYYCPFRPVNPGTGTGGSDAPGWVDVPTGVPLHNFVFTPTMNGCAYVITNSPTANHFRVHHHHHPTHANDPAEIPCQGAALEFDRFDESEYDLGSTAQRAQEGSYFGTFNFLWYARGAGWNFMSSMSEWQSHQEGYLEYKIKGLFGGYTTGKNDMMPWKRPSNYRPVFRMAKTW
jgi:hypothetical protein